MCCTKFGPIPLVRYAHRNTEVWRGGTLDGLDAQTDKNGSMLHMSASHRGRTACRGQQHRALRRA